MKKFLTVLLIVLLATSTVFAVDFSGRFRTGYTFNFGDNFSVSPWKNLEAKLTMKISDDAGIWTVNLKALNIDGAKVAGDSVEGGKVSLDSNDKLAANLSLDFAKLLAANNVDLGDVSLSASIGANTAMTALSAYNDVTGDEYYKLKNDGKYSAEVAVGYGNLIQTKIAVDPTVKEAPIVVSAKTAPVDGLSVSLAYAHTGIIYNSTDATIKAENAMGAAADVNIGTLVGLDFDLGVAVYDNYAIKANDGKVSYDGYNVLAAAVYGGVDLVDAYFELRADTPSKADTTLGMKTQVNLNLVENLGLDVYAAIADFNDAENTYKVGGDVSYTISGVEFAANLEYAAENSTFSVTPKVIVVF